MALVACLGEAADYLSQFERAGDIEACHADRDQPHLVADGWIAGAVARADRDIDWVKAIDASTGEIIGEGVLTPVAGLDKKEKVELSNFKSSGMDLADAIAVGEEYGVGSAISAGLEERKGKTIFVVVVLSDHTLREVAVEMGPPCRVKKRTHDHGPRRPSIVGNDC